MPDTWMTDEHMRKLDEAIRLLSEVLEAGDKLSEDDDEIYSVIDGAIYDLRRIPGME